jgi:hypothetical protein
MGGSVSDVAALCILEQIPLANPIHHADVELT